MGLWEHLFSIEVDGAKVGLVLFLRTFIEKIYLAGWYRLQGHKSFKPRLHIYCHVICIKIPLIQQRNYGSAD